MKKHNYKFLYFFLSILFIIHLATKKEFKRYKFFSIYKMFETTYYQDSLSLRFYPCSSLNRSDCDFNSGDRLALIRNSNVLFNDIFDFSERNLRKRQGGEGKVSLLLRECLISTKLLITPLQIQLSASTLFMVKKYFLISSIR